MSLRFHIFHHRARALERPLELAHFAVASRNQLCNIAGMNLLPSILTALSAIALANLSRGWAAEQTVNGRPSIVLETDTARVVVDLLGGAIGEFRFRNEALNPLSWGSPTPTDANIHGFGHFLCLDRWGPPSEAEGKLGMPYHGEASNVRWNTEATNTQTEATLRAQLPKAGLAVRRTVQLSPHAALFTVREEVRNEKPLGRIFNMVQHPTVAPPFLTETTVVDCNGAEGFAQGGTLPNPEEPSARWPEVIRKNGSQVDLRHLANDPDPNVVSFKIDEPLGWITATSPNAGLLIGYVWRRADYPWVSVWRDVHDGKPAARGLEFGTTGLHQPLPILVQKGRIWDRPLFEYIDADQVIVKEYAAFLLKIPKDVGGVDKISPEGNNLVVRERRPGSREWKISTEGLAYFAQLPKE